MTKINVKFGNNPGVYKITEKATGRVYIGQSCLAINDRLTQHVNAIKAKSGIDGEIAAKGVNAFNYEVLIPMSNPTTEQLWNAEAFYIALYGSKVTGYNKTKGNHVKALIEGYEKDIKNFYEVPENLFIKIRDQFNLNFLNKSILLVNNFNESVINVLKKWYNSNVIVIYTATDNADELGNYIKEEIIKMKNTHFDLVISNPPYGAIGNEITKNIIDNIKYDDFINLLPANDYRLRNKENELWKYVDIESMISFRGAFADATVTTHAARILHKDQKRNYISADEFMIENFTNPLLKKFFYENNRRNHYAFDSESGFYRGAAGTYDVNTTFIADYFMIARTCVGKEDSDIFKWNINKSITYADLVNNHNTPKARRTGTVKIGYGGYVFNTPMERDNFTKFIIENDECISMNKSKNEANGFVNKLWGAINVDNGLFSIAFPKVDWTKAWTPEEILRDYGYTDEEIAEVLA